MPPTKENDRGFQRGIVLSIYNNKLRCLATTILIILTFTTISYFKSEMTTLPLNTRPIPTTTTTTTTHYMDTTPKPKQTKITTIIKPPVTETVFVSDPHSNSNSNSNPIHIDPPPKNIEKIKPRIAYAVTVTKDGPFVDGALVLGYAAKKYHKGDYDIDLVAFVVPSVNTSRTILEQFGWRIIERTLPVSLDEIENQDYAQKMANSGCCGADEFLKLWAYTLTEYHRVIHLDMDSIIFQDMDEVFDQPYELLFTGDYNMMGGAPVPPAQGGFLVVRPSMDTFREFQGIIRKGDYKGGGGWGGSHIGNFWGGQTIQGIVPYFYHIIHKGNAKELNRCEYNCMVDNPYKKDTLICLDKQPTCQDCRVQEPDLVRSAHFTICQKPWTCTEHVNPRNKVLCSIFHDKWFALRDEFEKILGISTEYRAPLDKTRYKNSFGMCRRYGYKAYIPIPVEKVKKMVYPS